jgi:hypothetical protein
MTTVILITAVLFIIGYLAYQIVESLDDEDDDEHTR